MVLATQRKDSYTIGGVEYDRVSSVLSVISNGLHEWYGEVGLAEAKRISKEATGIGERVHSLIQMDIEGKDVELAVDERSEVKSCFSAYLDWKLERGLPENAIVDFKTSKRVDKSYWLQLAAYWLAFLENGSETKGAFSEQVVWSDLFGYAGTADLICANGGQIELIVVRLDKDLANYEQHVCKYSRSELANKFLSTLELYRYFKKENKK